MYLIKLIPKRNGMHAPKLLPPLNNLSVLLKYCFDTNKREKLAGCKPCYALI